MVSVSDGEWVSESSKKTYTTFMEKGIIIIVIILPKK